MRIALRLALTAFKWNIYNMQSSPRSPGAWSKAGDPLTEPETKKKGRDRQRGMRRGKKEGEREKEVGRK